MAPRVLTSLLFAAIPGGVSGQAWHNTSMLRLRTAGPITVGEPVVIGASLTLDCCSPYAGFGESYLGSYRMLLNWISENRGGIRLDGPNKPPRPLELAVFNDYTNPGKVRDIFNIFTKDMNLTVLLAPYGSDLTEIAAGITNRSGAVLMAPGAALTSVFRGRPNVFGTITPSTEYLTAPFEAIGGKAASVSYFFENAIFTKSVCSKVPSLAKAYNLTLNHAMQIPQEAGLSVVRDVVANLTQNPPDIVVGCVYNNVCQRFIREMKAQRLEPKATLFTICITDPTLSNLGDSATFHTGTTPWLPSFSRLTDEVTGLTAPDWARLYQKSFNVLPPYQAASAWASLLALVEAMEAARSTEPALVSAALRAMKKKTLYGQVAFDQNRQCTTPFKGVQLFQVGEDVKVVSPISDAERQLRYPMPTWQERECLSSGGSSSFGFMAGKCVECPGGFISTWSLQAFARVCGSCPSGTFPAFNLSSNQVGCEQCPIGKFGAAAAQRECDLCPKGRHADTLGQTDCSACPPGRSAVDTGTAVCAECCPGTAMPDAGAVLCLRCNRSSFMPGFGATSCLSCPPGLTTAGLGANAETECVCANGLFPSKPGNVTTCSPCPEGISCDWDTLDQASAETEPTLLPLYWSSEDVPLSVYRCESSKACPGGPPGSCGHLLEGTVCSSCIASYVLVRGSCIPCNAVERSGILYPAMPLVLGPIAVALVYWRSRDSAAGWDSWTNALSCLGFVGLQHYQILGLVAASSVMMPKAVGDTFIAWTYVLEITDFMRPGCSSYQGFKSNFTIRITLPLMALAVVVITWLASRITALVHPRYAMDPNILFNVYMSVLQAFYVFVASVSLKLFMCYPHPNGKSSLLTAPEVLCHEGDWNEVIGLSVAAIAVYVVALTAVIAYVICVAPSHFADVSFQRRWKFLFIRFKPSVWWWSLPTMVEGLCLNLSHVVFQDGVMQFSSILLTVLLYCCGMVSFYPWRHASANSLEKVTCSSIIFTAALSLMYTRATETRQDAAPLLMVFMSFVPMLVGLVLVAVLIRQNMCAHHAQRKVSVREGLAGVMREAFGLLARAPPEVVADLVRRLAEHDLAALEQARAVIMAELLGRQASESRWSRRLIARTPSNWEAGTPGAGGTDCKDSEDGKDCDDTDAAGAAGLAPSEFPPELFQILTVRI